jgi:hypothetical protein
MEARYKCCVAIHKAFMSSSKLTGNPALAPIAAKVRLIVIHSSFCFFIAEEVFSFFLLLVGCFFVDSFNQCLPRS